MKLTELVQENRRVEELARTQPLSDPRQLLPHAKAHPYYGFVEVDVPGAPPFVMFSNNDDAIAMRAFWEPSFSYEQHSLQLWIAAARTARAIADIGAYTGLYSLLAASVNSKCRIVAFEAVDFIYGRAFMNVTVNRFSNVKVRHRALSDTSGQTKIHLRFGPRLFSSGSSLLPPVERLKGSYEQLVQTSTADSELGDLPVDLCKLDVEGVELKVITGMASVLSAKKPLLLMEVLRPAHLKELSQALRVHGYDYHLISEEERRIHRDADTFWRSNESRNVLFSHPEGRIDPRTLL